MYNKLNIKTHTQYLFQPLKHTKRPTFNEPHLSGQQLYNMP